MRSINILTTTTAISSSVYKSVVFKFAFNTCPKRYVATSMYKETAFSGPSHIRLQNIL